ncbi:MAG: 4-(cytidine 5'-diphospho)-2-C-methyl-D-erythritol kinase, partial [Bacteroidetes bacterium]
MVIKKAYAKINIGLRILGKREDGYHDIETIFHRTNIFDRLIFELNKEIFISVSGFPLPNDNNNLSLRAANLLRQSYNLPFGVKIGLEKNIPIGAGLGGGSSDAAATLLGLRTLWNLPISIAELNVLAQQLGADVPYFLHDDSAYGTGRGDTLEYFHLDLPYWIVLVYPAIHVSTAWAYSQCPAK